MRVYQPPNVYSSQLDFIVAVGMSRKFDIGDRLSFDGALCTVRYIGDVEGTKGDWLGVEWDDPFRGKHSGEHKGKRYFICIYCPPFSERFGVYITNLNLQVSAISPRPAHLCGLLGP